MKKVLMSLAAVAAVFAGCQKPELEVAPVEVKDAFTATVENFDATKTALEGNHVVWSKGDQLAVFQGTGVADLYVLANGYEGLASGKFSLKGGMGDDFFGGMEMTDPRNVAFYPYAQDLAVYAEDGAWVVSNVTLPATQNFAQNSFGNGAFPMVAVTESLEDHVLRFKNVLGAVKFQFKGTATVQSVSLKGNNGEVLAGVATVTAHDGFETPSIVMAEGGAAELVLDCGEGVKLGNEATNFVFALPPVQFEKGFTVTVTYTNGKTYTVEAPANEVLRSGILVMPELTLYAAQETMGDVTLASNPGMTDVDLKISINNENATGFYAVYFQSESWDMFGPMLEDPELFAGVLSGMYSDMFPCLLYEGTSLSINLSQVGFSPEYLEYGYYNMLMPAMLSYVMVVPVVDGKEAYTLADGQLFPVSTSALVAGGDVALPNYSIVEGYTASDVLFEASDEVVYMMYDVYGADEVLPNEDNYLEEMAWANDAEYSPEEGCMITVDNSYDVLPGTEYKLCVVVAKASGESELHVIDVKTKALAYNEDLVVTVSAPEYDDLENTANVTIDVPAGAVKLYYTLNTQVSYTPYTAAMALVGIVEGTTDFDYVEVTEAGQVALNVPIGTLNQYGAKNVAVHVACIDADGLVSQWVSSAVLAAPKFTAPAEEE